MNRWMVDFDGVLANLQGALIQGCNERFRTHFTVDEVDSWRWWDWQPKKFSNYVWRELYPDAEWTLEHVEPYPGAIEALCDLLTDIHGIVADAPWNDDLGPPVQIITKRKNPEVPVLKPWLEKHLPAGVEAFVKGVGSTKFPKGHWCAARGLNVVVEDGAENLRMGMDWQKQSLFLVDRPWNQKERLPPRVRRVGGLEHAVMHMSGYRDRGGEDVQAAD